MSEQLIELGLLQEEEDVNPSVELAMFVARLLALGRTVEFIRLEDEGHQIAKMKNKLTVFPTAVRFLRQHLMSS